MESSRASAPSSDADSDVTFPSASTSRTFRRPMNVPSESGLVKVSFRPSVPKSAACVSTTLVPSAPSDAIVTPAGMPGPPTFMPTARPVVDSSPVTVALPLVVVPTRTSVFESRPIVSSFELPVRTSCSVAAS